MKLGTYILHALEGGPQLAERSKKLGASKPTLDVNDDLSEDLDDIVASCVYISVRRMKRQAAAAASVS